MRFLKSNSLILIAVIAIVIAIGISYFSTSSSESSITNSSSSNDVIAIDSTTRSVIMAQLNTVDPNNMSQAVEALSNVTTPSEIYFDFDTNKYGNLSDLISFLNAIGGGVNLNSPSAFGIPLNYKMVSAKILPGSTPYELKLVVGVQLDKQSLYKVGKLLKNQSLISKYNPTFNFGFVTDTSDSFALDTAILENKRPLFFDVVLYRQNANGNWDSLTLTVDSSNNLKPLSDDDDDSNS
jgi:hypothetical protein